MKNLIDTLESRLAPLPVAMAVELPSGKRVGKPQAEVTLRFRSLAPLTALAAGHIGTLGAAVVEGQVELEGRVRDIMRAASALLQSDPVRGTSGWWSQIMARTRSMALHTLARDAEQIEFHYDLSDDFYALWLDPRRVYSCAYFREPGMGLAQAQEAKLDHICRKLQLRAGESFLDIGAGWGGLLLWAAEHYGVQARGITLSRNQHAYVQQLIAARGLQERVRIELRDYRQLPPDTAFDKIASVGMFEHVGHAQMPAYAQTVHRLLRPGGLALLHGITAGGVDNAQVGAGMGEFIGRYIFPGGELLHVSRVLHAFAQGGLEMCDTENLRPHYARTLWAWSDALEARLPEAQRILAEQTDSERGARALRAYRLYLAGCAMGFERGWIALHQMLVARPDGQVDGGALPGARSEYPFNREYMYRKGIACPTSSSPVPPPI
ncbi:class I SAM-dependent methyltransferase [Comamonas endophytica]|uniref:Class I SAM-dependent methyltransferase n=1 Tax=Comamonas endophytica TaxID=2949090 RepID=A0ABY6G666_9BURK|nr:MULTISPECIES: class I SAM-dependent methyltransferase [unclassified Acidovorax]MCD2511001.1 class I SAM-dependent methyltransferase [Acidovorax sp. D4N7]UYG50408.1 class I SAM-dependent methyltransferase [Acidovorax sp. 5MLIR]